MALFPMAVITLFWKDHIGLSLTEILLLQGLFSVATVLMEYPSGYLSDRLGYRLSLNIATILGLVGWCLYLPADSFFDVFLAEIFLGASFAFISGSDSALLYETLRTSGKQMHYTRYDGRMNGFAQAGEAAGALFAGVLYTTWPLLPFVIQIGVWLAAYGLSRSLEEIPRDKQIQAHSHLGEALDTLRMSLVDNRTIRAALLLTTVLGLASFFPVWLIQPFMQQTGVPLHWFGPVWAAANMTVAVFSWTSERIHFQLGTRPLAVLWLLLVLAGYGGLGLFDASWAFAFYFLLTATRGMQAPVMRHFLQAEAPSSRRASILSLKSLLFRLLFVLTGPLVGMLADAHGLATTFLVVGMTLFVVLISLTLLFFQ
ncbi:MAG: MFS transporter, partial [Desulfuromonadales bacterium]|nr:MFS transporter [Desulfuromonadales bacterium]NIS39482.1 MFS transporter [Desulfuromonadales bacterium]